MKFGCFLHIGILCRLWFLLYFSEKTCSYFHFEWVIILVRLRLKALLPCARAGSKTFNQSFSHLHLLIWGSDPPLEKSYKNIEIPNFEALLSACICLLFWILMVVFCILSWTYSYYQWMGWTVMCLHRYTRRSTSWLMNLLIKNPLTCLKILVHIYCNKQNFIKPVNGLINEI